MASKRKSPPTPLFDEIVFAPDRDRVPGTRRVVSWDPGDDPQYLKAIEEVATLRVELQRRGRDHGAWAELDLSASGIDPLRHAPDVNVLRERWQASRPILLPGQFADAKPEFAVQGLDLGARLTRPGALRAWIDEQAERLPQDIAPSAEVPDTDARTLEKLTLTNPGGPDLWLKSARLSAATHDESLRLRCSFGREVEDDASRDENAHLAVTRLAEAVLPGALRIDLDPKLARTLTELVGPDHFLTQHIAYWNAPDGGALMHHDAFAEEDNGGQRGVVYTQLSGCTAWLCLSIEDLADRLGDYFEFLEQGGADWVRKDVWPDRHDFERLLSRTRDRRAFLHELALPGCGLFGGLVNYGPDFTSFLADAGHAFFVRAGDSLLMPSHGLERCAMHSVFCASEERTYAISAALRAPRTDS